VKNPQRKPPLEKVFQTVLKKELKQIQGLYFFVKEAGSLRGHSDILGCYNGIFIALELKRSAKEAAKTTGRICLQRHFIDQIKKHGGYGAILCPENYKEELRKLKEYCS